MCKVKWKGRRSQTHAKQILNFELLAKKYLEECLRNPSTEFKISSDKKSYNRI